MSRATSDMFAISTVLAIVGGGSYASWLLATGWWWNRETTLAVNDFPSLAVVAAAASVAALVVMRYWFRTRSDLPSVPEWNLKHDRPGLWVVTGSGLCLIAAGSVAWVTHTVVRTTVPHLGGQQMLVEAVVQSVGTSDVEDELCEKEASFLLRGNETLSVCVKPKVGDELSSIPLESGQSVAITVASNFLGASVVRVHSFDLSVETSNTAEPSGGP